MSLSPLDISRHEFSRALRGYDPAEVQAFLERLADEIAALQSQVNSLAEQNRVYAAKLSAYQEMEQNLRDSLVATQESQKMSKEQIEQERQQVLREARLDAEQLKFEAQRDIVAFREELRALKLHRDAFVKRLRFLLKSHNELIDLIEQESPEITHDRPQETDY
ncbi:MAG: DivIVA domain-containing protein [Calditrichota bacterium]